MGEEPIVRYTFILFSGYCQIAVFSITHFETKYLFLLTIFESIHELTRVKLIPSKMTFVG